MTQGVNMPSVLANRARRGLIETAAASLGSSRPPFLCIQGNRLALVNASGEQRPVPTFDPKLGPYIDIVIVDVNAHKSKMYYPDKWEPNSTAAPLCFSDNGTGPSINAQEPQAPTCTVCRHNVRGSAISQMSGAEIKACRDQQQFAFIYPPEWRDGGSGTVYQLTVTPGSIKNMRDYMSFLGKQILPGTTRKADLMDFVTRVYFEAGKTGCLKFQAAEWADDQGTVDVVEYLHQNQLTDEAVGRNDQARDPESVRALLENKGSTPVERESPQEQAFQLPSRQTTAPLTPTNIDFVRAANALPSAQEPPTAQAAAKRGPGRPRKPVEVLPPPATVSQEPAEEPIPAFLTRRRNGPEATQQAASRFGLAEAPPPPDDIASAVQQAMSVLPKR